MNTKATENLDALGRSRGCGWYGIGRHCPVCGETDRKILHSDLIDNAFRVAPGKWALWKCAMCSGAYLDPRPNPATIHLAYANYYTHQEVLGKDDYGT